MDKTISSIINKALDGTDLSAVEVAELFRVEDLSEEAFAIQQAGRRFSAELLDGKAEIHGQIGINTGLCGKDCKFCSFAASNKVFTEATALPVDEAIGGVLSMEAQGANAIYVMSTANFAFEDFIDVSKAIKRAMKTDIPLVANTGDFDLDEAKALVEAGYTGVYHAIRMGEGEFTRIPLERRVKTIEAAKEAGLIVGMCVEPVGPEHSIDELVEKTLLTRDLEAYFSGSMRRTTIPSSPLAVHGQVSYARMATIVAAVALATGTRVPGNCTHEPNALGVHAGANLVWAEVGSNPRDTEAETVRGWTVNRCRELYQECGWEVLEGPSKMFAK
ncbi:MAG: radical SAM protein [Eggerthellaceae bacterium]|nr:radical SAM protein [Eggerthellaceae bacterium]